MKVFKHYKKIHKNGTKEEKKEIIEILRKVSQDDMVYDTHHKKKINLKDSKAEALFKELKKVEPIKIESKGIKSIQFKINSELKLVPTKR